jgi:hypothetical protein
VLYLKILLQVLAVMIAMLTARLDYGPIDRRTRNFKLRRRALLLLSILFLAASIATEYFSSRADKERDNETLRRRLEDRSEIANLRGVIRTEQVAHERASKQSLTALDMLQQRLSSLQTKVETEELRSELSTYQRELRQAREVLTPGPKASLVAGIMRSSESDDNFIDTPTVRRVNGVVTITFWAKNISTADANHGNLWFRLCDQCEVVEPPTGLQHVAGANHAEYGTSFVNMGADTRLGPYTFKVRTLPTIRSMGFAFRYACQTCVVETRWKDLWVYVEPELKLFRSPPPIPDS